MSEAAARDEPLYRLPVPGEVLLDKYRIERLIGRGGMGAVYEALHLQLHERLAIKFLLPALAEDADAIARFEREARAAIQIKDEHVARLLDVGVHPSSGPFLVMEFLEGQDVADLLKGSTGFGVADAVELVLQACEAVAEAHSLGIIHRDLKPENLFLTRRRDGSRCVKVLDFGLSKFTASTGAASPRRRALTQDDKTLGTPNYMAPEQWAAASKVGPAADQWALGAILYELLAGVPAFNGGHLAQVCSSILHQAPRPLGKLRAGVPPGLVRAVETALEKNPGARYPSLAEFAAAIADFAAEQPRGSAARISAVLGRAGLGPDAPRHAARSILVLATGGLVLGIVLVGTALLIRSRLAAEPGAPTAQTAAEPTQASQADSRSTVESPSPAPAPSTLAAPETSAPSGTGSVTSAPTGSSAKPRPKAGGKQRDIFDTRM